MEAQVREVDERIHREHLLADRGNERSAQESEICEKSRKGVRKLTAFLSETGRRFEPRSRG